MINLLPISLIPLSYLVSSTVILQGHHLIVLILSLIFCKNILVHQSHPDGAISQRFLFGSPFSYCMCSRRLYNYLFHLNFVFIMFCMLLTFMLQCRTASMFLVPVVIQCSYACFAILVLCCVSMFLSPDKEERPWPITRG